jgi:hypothetical protein
MFLGADFPPPIGFIWVVVLILLLDLIQWKYLHFFLEQIHKKRKHLFSLNLLFFLIGGILVSLFALAANNNTTLSMRGIDIIIWIVVVSLVGLFYGVYFWFFNRLLLRKSIK